VPVLKYGGLTTVPYAGPAAGVKTVGTIRQKHLSLYVRTAETFNAHPADIFARFDQDNRFVHAHRLHGGHHFRARAAVDDHVGGGWFSAAVRFVAPLGC
jgi:hypothetical protein